MTFADGKPYVNTLYCFDRLCRIGAQARHLDLVDPAKFEDRRNPDPIINAHRRLFEDEIRTEMGELEDGGWAGAMPKIPGPYFLNVGDFEIPQPEVTGYDYEAGDQPVLIEIWIEKTTMNDILVDLCRELQINLVPASGMQSITNAVRLLQRCEEHGKPGHVIYISDFDSAGDVMPRAAQTNHGHSAQGEVRGAFR